MTYDDVLVLAQAYLISDNKIPADEETKLLLLEDALLEVADRAAAMNLASKDAGDVLRLGSGDSMLVRMPTLPSTLGSQIDMDHELAGPVARFIAAVVSKDSAEKHISAANRRILNYNAKVYDTIDSLCVNDNCGTIVQGNYIEDTTWA